MNKKLKKIFQIIGISFGSLLLLVFVVLGVALNFIFTPEKLTPMVVKVANHSLNAKLDVKSVELTFFSTFPQFGLEIKEGSLVSKALRDTLWNKTDSLVNFRECAVQLNPLDFVLSKKINIGKICLKDAHVYAFRNVDGKANWDIVQADTTQNDTANTSDFEIQGIAVNRIQLDRSNIVFDDRNTRIYARMDSANLEVSGKWDEEKALLNLKFNNRNILFWQNGELLAHHIRTALHTDLHFDRKAKLLTMNNAGINVNGIALDMNGTMRHDSLHRTIDTDLNYSLHAPTLETVLHLIPESVVKRGAVDAKGEVLVQGKIKGEYGEGKMPLATLDFHIKNAAAHYKDMPYGIDDIEMDFKAYLDLMRRTPSYADLQIFRFEGAHTTILADARIDHLLDNPQLKFNIKSEVDLTALAKTFPLQEGVTLEGKLSADLSAQCRLSDLQRQDYGRARVNGLVKMNQLAVKDDKHNFDFHSDASFEFTGKDKLTAQLMIDKIQLQSPQFQSSIKNMKADIDSNLPKDTTQIVNVTCHFEANEIKAQSGDSMVVFGKSSKVMASLHPGKQNPQMPEISLSLDADSLYCRLNDHKLGMDKGGFGIRAEKVNDSIWTPSGIVGFHHLVVSTPEIKLPIILKGTAVTVKDQQIMLKKAKMQIGKSDLMATGAIYNIYHALKKKHPLRAKLDIVSNNLDGNQLINALNSSANTFEEGDSVSSETPMELFVIPKNIDFELNTRLSQMTYGKMKFENVQGAVDVRQQAIHLKHLNMRGLDADMHASLVYQAKEKKRGYAGFDFQLEKVNIGKLVDFIPALDSIVPMLRSFKGIVNFDAKAETQLDSALNIQIPTLRSAVHIKGDSLVLMDGETFAEISKIMMFKNKKRNLIDSIYVNMTVNEGNVTVYPFVVQMDRYRAAVGGTQDLDMNFKYHISVLKSPVPFKLGVNITGNLDKMKFRIGKAKYKDQVTPVAIRRVDSTRINLGKDIIRDFENIIKNSENR